MWAGMSRPRSRRLLHAALALLLCLAVPPSPARAWLAPGHMATGALAYDALERRDPAAVRAITALEASHPDHARFEAALDGLKGAPRDRRLFELMARWPDDARGGPYDHPDWHWSEKIVSPMGRLLPFAWGRARPAFARELRLARDPAAPAAERAVALCWVLHIAGDMHEPEHAGLWMDRRFPLTDQAGNTAWVRTTPATRPEKLHWLWDSAGDPDPDAARARDPDALAARLEAEHPDPGLAPPPPPDVMAAYDGWVDESRTMARRLAYRDGALPLGTTPARAALLPPGYLDEVQAAAEARLALAGYRIAGVLEGLR